MKNALSTSNRNAWREVRNDPILYAQCNFGKYTRIIFQASGRIFMSIRCFGIAFWQKRGKLIKCKNHILARPLSLLIQLKPVLNAIKSFGTTCKRGVLIAAIQIMHILLNYTRSKSDLVRQQLIYLMPLNTNFMRIWTCFVQTIMILPQKCSLWMELYVFLHTFSNANVYFCCQLLLTFHGPDRNQLSTEHKNSTLNAEYIFRSSAQDLRLMRYPSRLEHTKDH